MTDLNLLGRTIGRFEILDELGRGGMAVVYKARQRAPNRIVALKVLPPALTHDTNYIARFLREADSAAALEHPHIVPIYTVEEADGFYFIAMKYIQGRTLKEVVQQEGAMQPARAAILLGQVAQALDYAHAQGVIHRDIKPSNMMMADGGWMYLTDFGLARGTDSTTGLTISGTVMGTPEYMSPEQAQGAANVGPATDIYAMGVVLYELLTGQFPFQSDTPMGMLMARLVQAPRPPRDYKRELPEGVEDVIMRALARRPEARYKTAGALVADLQRATGDSSVQGTSASSGVVVSPPPTPSGGTNSAPRPQTPLPTTPVRYPTPQPPLQQPTYQTPTPPSQLGYPSPTQPVSQPSYQQPTWGNTPGTPPASKNNNRGLIIGLVAGLVALVVLVGAIVALLRSSGGSTTPTQIGRATAAATSGATGGPTQASSSPTAGVSATGLIQSADDVLGKPGGFAAAITLYEQALKEDDSNTTALAQLALLRDLKGDRKNALSLTDNAIKLANDQGSDAALAHAIRSRVSLAQGDVSAALDEAKLAIDRDSKLSLAFGARARALAAAAAARNDQQQMQQAIDVIQQTLTALGDESQLAQAVAHADVGYAYWQETKLYNSDTDNNRFTTALRRSLDQTSQAMNALPQVPAFHTAVGLIYVDQSSYTQARSQFDTAIKQDSDAAEAYAGIGWSYFYEGKTEKYPQAIEAFDKAIQLNGDLAFPFYGKGRVLLDQDKFDEASAQFTEAAKRSPKDAQFVAWQGRAAMNKGFNTTDSAIEKEAYSQAEQLFRAALELNDRLTLAQTNLGWILQYTDRYQESVDQFQSSLAVREDQDDAHNGIAWSLYNLNRFQEAEVHFRRAVKLYKNYTNAFYGLGQTLEKLNRIDEAKQAYNDALRVDPEYKSAKDALAKLPQ